jgi:hypothetical protein
MFRRSDLGVVLVLVICLAAAVFATAGFGAKPSLKPPKVGTWKLIAAENTADGLKVLGGVVGSFQVVGDTTIKNFHLTFKEEGESVGCAGGESFEGKGEDKKGTIKFASGATAPIIKTTAGYLVAVGNSTSVQGAEVPLTLSVGSGDAGLLYIDLVPRKKKEKRSGQLSWQSSECGLAFVVKPG